MQSGHIYKVPPPWTGPIQTSPTPQQQQQNMYNQQQYVGGPPGGIQPGTATGVPSYSGGFRPQANQYQQPGASQYQAPYSSHTPYQQPSTYQQPPPPPPPPPSQWGQQQPQQQWSSQPPAPPPRPQSTVYNPMNQTYSGQAYGQYGQSSAPVPPPPPPPVQTSPYGQQQQQVYQNDNLYQQQQAPAEQIHQSQGHQWGSTPQQQYVQVAEQGQQQQQGYYTGNAYGQDNPTSPTSEHPAYIPPSLSGAGVNAYQPADTNPAPGVYIPPPPPNIPAWGSAQHDGPKKKFTYTPPVLHPDYATPSNQYTGNQQPQAQTQQQQYQYHGSPKYTTHEPQQQYQEQPAPPPPPPVVQNEQDKFWPQTQQGQYEQPQQQYQQNPPPQPLPDVSAYHSHFQQQQQPPPSTPTPPPPPPRRQDTFSVPPAPAPTTTFTTGPVASTSWEHYSNAPTPSNDGAPSRPTTPVAPLPAQNPVKPSTPVGVSTDTAYPPYSPSSQDPRYPAQFHRPGSAFQQSAAAGFKRPPSRASESQRPPSRQGQAQRPPSRQGQIQRPPSRQGQSQRPVSTFRPGSAAGISRPHTGTPKNTYAHPEIAEMATTSDAASPQQHQQQQSGSAAYVLKDPRFEWAESPGGGMTNVQGPPLEEVVHTGEQMWPVKEDQQKPQQGWPQAPGAQKQECGGWPKQEQQPVQQESQGWPQASGGQQVQESGGWPQQQQQQEDSSGWPQPGQQAQQQQPVKQQDTSGWPKPEQPAQQDASGWPRPGQAQTQTQQSAQTQQDTHGWPRQQQDSQSWPQPPQSQESQQWPQPPPEHQDLPTQPQQESLQRKPYWQQPTKQDQQAPAPQADVGPVPGGWPQPVVQQQQHHHEQEASVPGGWPQPGQPTQAYAEVRPVEASAYVPEQQQTFTPSATVTPASPAPHVEDEESDPLENLDQFYRDSVGRFIDMIQAEVAATTDEEKLKVFTGFMENEYFVRGQRYPNALGSPSRQSSLSGKEKLAQVAEVAAESKPVEPQQQAPPPPAQVLAAVGIGGWPVPEQAYTSPIKEADIGGRPDSGPRPRSPTSFPEVVTEAQRPQTPKPSTRSPEPPISPKPLVINKRSSVYQPFHPDAAPKSPSKYVAFNPNARGSSPSGPASPGRGQDNQYLPFHAPAPPGPSQGAPEPNQSNNPLAYKYGAMSPPGGRGSPTPIGPERGSQYVPYDPSRASVVMSSTPVPGAAHSKRSSVAGAYPPPARADTIPVSPTASSGPQPFGPLRGAKTFVDGHQPYPPGSTYPSSGGSSNVFSTPEPEEQAGREAEGYFPSVSPSAMEPTQPVQPIQAQRAAPLVSAELKTLSAVLPGDRAPRVQSSKVLDDVRMTIEAIGEDFSFIQDINRVYTESAKKRRRSLDDDRRKRIEEHEAFTDGLFTDEQIGYGDIKDMEMEFKSEETRREAKEEEDEYERYCSEVFQKVYDNLQEGIKGLMDKYLSILRDIPDAVAGKERWNMAPGVELTELLEGLLELRKYVETRHEKVQAAIIERDRRFKKTVIQPLYASGNIGKMKSMEKHFEESEKKTIHQAAGEKLQRTQQLMETIVESIERGLDAEINYTDEITAAVLALVATLPAPGDTNLMKNELNCAHTTLKDLKETSVKFMNAFHAASLLHNAGTNEVALAAAKLAGSGKDVIATVAKEKDIADQETDKELQERVGVVDGDFAVVDTSIVGALKLLDEAVVVVEDRPRGSPIDRVMSPAAAAASQPPPKGPQGQGQGQGQGLSALERAKMRNATGGSRIPYS